MKKICYCVVKCADGIGDGQPIRLRDGDYWIPVLTDAT